VSSAAATIVSDAVTALRRAHPELDLTVIDEEPARSLAALAAGDVDLAVVDEYDHAPRRLDAGLTATTLLVEPLVVVTPADQATAPRRLVDLKDETWVVAPASAACGDAVRSACRAVGFTPRGRWETDDLLLHLHHVAAGHGIAVLPRLAVRPEVAGVLLHDLLDPALTRRLLAVTRTATVPRPAVAQVVAALVEASPG
jgi:DNA-binding transcriptional LysR family regulator